MGCEKGEGCGVDSRMSGMVEELLKEVVDNGYVTCRQCGNRMESDAEKCYCGWLNPLVAEGFV